MERDEVRAGTWRRGGYVEIEVTEPKPRLVLAALSAAGWCITRCTWLWRSCSSGDSFIAARQPRRQGDASRHRPLRTRSGPRPPRESDAHERTVGPVRVRSRQRTTATVECRPSPGTPRRCLRRRAGQPEPESGPTGRGGVASTCVSHRDRTSTRPVSVPSDSTAGTALTPAPRGRGCRTPARSADGGCAKGSARGPSPSRSSPTWTLRCSAPVIETGFGLPPQYAPEAQSQS